MLAGIGLTVPAAFNFEDLTSLSVWKGQESNLRGSKQNA